MQVQSVIEVLVVSLLLFAGCADTPERVDDSGEATKGDCPAWKIPVETDGRTECVDEQILDREREIIDLDRDW